MVQFNELRITDNKTCLTVSCFVENLSMYSGMYIKSIDVYYYKNYSTAGGSSEHAINIYSNTSDDTTVKSVRKTLYAAQLESVANEFGTSTFAGGLFYVVVECDGTLGSGAALYECGADSTVDVGVVVDWEKIYSEGMRYITSYYNNCKTPCDVSLWEDFILRWNALKLAIATCDWDMVNTLWDKIFFRSATRASASGCGCGA